MCILPILTCGCQTWTLNEKHIDLSKIRIAQNEIERSILNVKIKERIPIKIMKRKLKFNKDTARFMRR